MCAIVEVQRDLEKIKTRFSVDISANDELRFNNFKQINPKIFKEPKEDNLLYPGYFAWVMIYENGKNVLKKMRYRIRPSGSNEEIPSKFNVFNARSDSLLIRPTWKSLFGKKHGIFPFVKFYEWVVKDGKKIQISFFPKNREIMWAPCLWDYWENGQYGFYSFALITNEPPLEVSKAGHDRCPIFLKEKNFNIWLNPKSRDKSMLLNLLKDKEDAYFEYSIVA